MSSPVILDMDFMLHASITIHVQKRIASIGAQAERVRGVQGDAPRLKETVCALEDPDLTCSQENASTISVKAPDASSRNPVQSDQGSTDLLPEHAVTAGLDLRAQPPVELTDKEYLRHLQCDNRCVPSLKRTGNPSLL
ncbi:hypothetical protein SRHO_G00032900 [Serrasalmus rhombeus]